MPTPSAPQPVIKRYYPTLSSVVTLDDFPESLGFLKQAIESLFSKIHYKDLQYKKSPKGDAAFYSLSIVSNKLAIELFGSGISLVLNPDESETTDFNISAFPVTVEYQWKILAYLRSFDLNNFSFTPQEFFELGLIILNISEEQALAQFINTFTVPIDEDTLALEQFVNDLKQYNSDPVIQSLNITINEDSRLTEVVQAINEHTGKYVTLYAFGAYLLNNDLNETKKKLEAFFRAFIPTDIESYIKDILIPKVRATLTVSAAIEFPRKILYPYQDTDGNGIWEREPENTTNLTRFYFGKILLYADTQAGVGYKMDLVGDLRPTYSEIGKTGLLLQLEKLKLDLSDKVNIPEADADGRPVDFRGVYADALSVTLPAKWFKSGTNTNGSTLRIGGYNLLIGTGGVSGTFALEAVPTQNPSDGQIIDFFSDKFEFVYPIKGLKNNVTTNNEEVIEINNEVELLSYLNSLTNKSLYNFKFPLEVSSSGIIKEFNSSQEFRNFITSFIIADNGTMWANVGGDNGFLVGFQKFDITFKQNKVISSNIKGKLEIKKFIHPDTGLPVHIDILGHLSDNGDFNLTASAQPPYPIEFPEVFTYRMKSVELGKEDDDFYIGTSGTLQFEGFLKETLNLGPIEIERLRIYSDGSIELRGGSVQLIDPIVLPLGPVEITVSAIHYGSHQKEVDGVMRKFNYFGFDGGVSIDPLGVEVRGDGVKYYYCSDNLPNKPKPYLHIQTLYLDLIIPADTGAIAQINGWVTIPEPGISKEYAGEIALKIPKAKLAGKAGIKLMPKYPAFIIDCELEPPVPIALGSFAIFGFRGLLGYRYVAEKQAVAGLTSDNTWYEYYKAPKLGINVQKFNGPDKSVNYNTLISLGAGATLGTSADDGYTFSIKAMALFSIPSLFMIDGRANILAKRLGLNDTQDPPFFAFVAVGDNSLELGFGADYKLPASGNILEVYAEVQAGFFFKNQKPWYINIGTNINPVTSRILTLLTIKSYVMLSASGMEAGARGEFNFDRNYGVIKVRAHAFIEIGGRVSFERPQMGAYLMAGVQAEVKALFVTMGLEVGILFGVEAPKPFLIYGKFYFSIKVGIKIFGKRITLFKFSGNLEVVWNINKNIDRTPLNPINPLITTTNSNALPASVSAMLHELVQGVNMLTNETFVLGYLDAKPSENILPSKIQEYVVPLDTYIDIKTQKGLLPGNAQDPNNSVRKLIGGINNAPANYVDLIPPVSTIRGRSIRQVKHQYTIEYLEIKFWNTTKSKWENYHPYEALYPTDSDAPNLKVGQFQKRDGVYNALRILATTPFSYTEQGQPGWYVPEQYGINASTLFCEAAHKEHQCADFLLKPLQAKYYCGNPNTPLFSNEAAFNLITENQDDFAYISNETNSFNIEKSLAFDNWNSMEIILPDSSVMTALKLSNYTSGVKVKFYSIIQNLQNDVQFNVVYGNPNPSASNQNEPFEMVLSATELQNEIRYNFTLNNGEWQAIAPNWRAVKRIVIEPIFDPLISQQIALLNEQIAEMELDNELIAAGVIDGEVVSPSNLEHQLQNLMCGNGTNLASSFINSYLNSSSLNYYYSIEFFENNSSFFYSIGTFKDLGLISKVKTNGDIEWQKSYKIDSEVNPLVFKRIVQLNNTENQFQYVVYATTGDTQYILSIDGETAEVLWTKKVFWKDLDVLVQIDASKTDSSFYLTISDRNQIDTHKFPFIARFDENGNVITSSQLILPNEEFIINSMETDNHGVVVAGRYIDKDSQGVIIRLNPDLKTIDSLQLSYPNTTIHDIKIIDGKYYLVSGYNNQENSLFVSLIKDLDSNVIYNIPNTKNHGSVIEVGNDGIYLLQTTESHGVLNKLNFDLELIWKKEIKLNNNNGIRNFTYNTQTQKITLNAYNQSVGSLLVYTDKELQSCLTQSLEIQELKISDCKIELLKVEQKEYGVELKEISTVKEGIPSEKKQWCPQENEGGCPDEDPLICDLYHQILTHFETYYIAPELAYENFSISGKDDIIRNLIRDFNGSHPNYNLLGDTGTITQPYNTIVSYFNFDYIYNYNDLYQAVITILNYLAEIGNCECKCERKEFTLIHQVCWMTLEDYEYNINIPSQAAIQADAQATIDGLTQYIQPIWRPDTNYYIHFVLKDNVDNGNVPGQSYPFTYGFSTAGPLGFFHTHEKSTYGDIQLKPLDKLLKVEDNSYFIVDNNGLKNEDGSTYIANTNGFILEDTTGVLKDAVTKNPIMVPGSNTERKLKVTAHPDKYPLTSLKQYIDYNRSYPNADGNLLSAKPLFYNDEGMHPTQIQLFFSKAYATHFFQMWDDYKNEPSYNNKIDGRLKIVIKDPVVDVSFDNPPSLNYDASITNIPQTELTWDLEENPQIPFAINQYLSMYNASKCIGSVTVIKPASEYVTIIPKHLKPNKLYTVIVNNLFDVNHDGAFGITATVEETREVHKFVFKTSRYKDFEAQITSYTLEQNIDGNTVSRNALFTFEKQFELNEINGAYTTIVNWNNGETNQIPLTGFSIEVLNNLNNNYQHPYDRIFEGIFGLKPWDEPISTEVNVLKDLNTGNKIALIVRNPEPFNNPKFRKEVIVDTIQVFKNGVLDESFKVLFSKDNSQAILMNASMNITENLELKFKYKVYKDFLPGDDAIINYPVMKEVILSIDLLNN